MATKVLAVASSGGHWVQLMRATARLRGVELVFASTDATVEVGTNRLFVLPDASKNSPFRLLWLLAASAFLVIRTRPGVVISTGAAPGAIVAIFSKLAGSRVIWIDSLANASGLSLSGRIVAPVCDVRLSQWEDVARANGWTYRGSLL